MEKHLPYFQSDFVHDFINVCQRLQHEKKQRSEMRNLLLRYTSAVIPNAFSCVALYKEESDDFVLQMEELRQTAT